MSPREFALLALQSAVVGATVVLFAIWLMSADGRRPGYPGVSPLANCESLGRGRTLCPPRDENEFAKGKTANAAAADCQSFGRGGLVCPEPAAD